MQIDTPWSTIFQKIDIKTQETFKGYLDLNHNICHVTISIDRIIAFIEIFVFINFIPPSLSDTGNIMVIFYIPERSNRRTPEYLDQQKLVFNWYIGWYIANPSQFGLAM